MGMSVATPGRRLMASVLTALTLAAASGTSTASAASPQPSAPAVPGERIAVVVNHDGSPEIFTVQAAAGRTAELLATLARQPSVESAEIDGTASLSATTYTGTAPQSDDPGRTSQWALDRLRAEDVRAAFLAAGHSWSEVPVVAILDTGIQGSHPDLAGRTVAGYDLIAGAPTAPGASVDPHGHGTHVAGIVGANVGDGVGVSGLLDGARLMPVRVVDENGSGSLARIARGMVWAVDHGAQVLNMSLGSASSSQALAAAAEYAAAHGVVVVAAAGNSGASTNGREYPCTYSTVICVGATDAADHRAGFSTFGTQVDVAAPGNAILSTYKGSQYYYGSGTSMATPYTAAAVALLRATYPGDSAASLAARLAHTADDLGAPGRDPATGAGLIDLVRAAKLQPAASPAAPASLRVTFGGPGRAVVRFGTAAPRSSAAVSGYRLRVGTRAPITVGAAARSVSVTGLTPGTRYRVSVAALSAAGEGRLATTAVTAVDALTATVTATTSAAVASGGRVRVRATVRGRSAVTGRSAPVAGVPLEVYAGRSATSMSRRATVTTDATGAAAYVLVLRADTVLQFRYRGRPYGGPSTGRLPVTADDSPRVTARVRPAAR
jgi:hypothetical protein